MRIIRITDDPLHIIMTLCKGNPGAMHVLSELLRASQRAPLVFAWSVEMFLQLGLDGSEIYMLWNDCLNRSDEALVTLVEDYMNGVVHADEILPHIRTGTGRGTEIMVPRRSRTWLY